MTAPRTLDTNQTSMTKKAQLPQVLRPRLGGKQRLPTGRPGDIVISPEEEAKLRAIGWKPGMMIPGHLGELIQKAQGDVQNAKNEFKAARPPMTQTRAHIGRVEDLSTLEGARRQEIERALEQFQTLGPQLEAATESGQDMAQLSPAVQAALRKSGGVEVTDSRLRHPVADDFQRRIDIAEGKIAPTQGEDTVDFGLLSDEGDVHVDQPQAKVTAAPYKGATLSTDTLSMDDKLTYEATVLGGLPFKKQYRLLGGKLILTFQELSTGLGEMAFSQVCRDSRIGTIGTYDMPRQLMLYRAMLALEKITVNGETTELLGSYLNFLDEAKSNELDVPEGAISALFKATIQSYPLNNESIWRLVKSTYEQFDKVLGELEKWAQDPNFGDAAGN